MSRSPSASRSASRKMGSSGHRVSALGSRPRARLAFQSLMPSAHWRSASTLPEVLGRRRSIGSRSGGTAFSAPAWPDAMSDPRLSMARWRALASSSASSRFARMPSASTTASGSSLTSSASARSRLAPPSRPDARRSPGPPSAPLAPRADRSSSCGTARHREGPRRGAGARRRGAARSRSAKRVAAALEVVAVDIPTARSPRFARRRKWTPRQQTRRR